MKISLLILSLIICASCTKSEKAKQVVENQNKPTIQASSSNYDSIDSEPIEPKNTGTQEIEGNDCVFNNDYKTLTSDWLKELSISDFTWDESLKQAKVPIDGDTIFVSQGGCVLFGFLVMRRYYHTKMIIDKQDYWVSEAKELASTFGFTHYNKMLTMDSFKVIVNSPKNYWLEIEDDDLNDNLYYNGVEIIQRKNYLELSISKYLN